MDQYGDAAPGARPGVDPHERRRHQGPDHDPGRDRVAERERGAPEGARPVRCLRPCKSYPGVPLPYEDVDLVIVRENNEDLYAGIEFEQGDARDRRADRVHLRARRQADPRGLRASRSSRSRCTGTKRIVRYAFDYARRYGRKKVTAVPQGEHHEVLRRAVPGGRAARWPTEYPDIAFEDRIVDDLCMQLVQRPRSTTCWSCRTSTATS